MHFHHTREAIVSALATIPANVKQSQLLSGDWKGNYAVAAIVIDGIQPPAEVHMHAADVWIVVAGTPSFILGGNLESPTQVRDGEFVADSITSGKKIHTKPGDVIDIPPGVPHQVDATGQRAEFLIIKIPINSDI
jgi:mannose-6-phosphate isomerase-like protein (cupin superfamily)